jgi:predicted metal-dependent hydrolase
MAEHVELRAEWGTMTIPFILVRADRNTLRITVDPEGAVTAYAPLAATDQDVIARVTRRGGWITRQLEAFDQWRPRTPTRQYISGETHLFLGKQYRLAIRRAEGAFVGIEGDRIVLELNPGATFAQRKALLLHWYKLQAHRHFPAQLAAIWPRFARLGISCPRLIIRLLSRRWGSFTPKGSLVLNAELVQASPHLVEYVLHHEIAHAVHPNHGAEWKALMDDTMPGWRDRKHELEKELL